MMFNIDMNILLGIITLPFTSISFYKKQDEEDFIEKLSKKDSYKEYEEEYSKDNGLKSAVLRELVKKQLIFNFDNINLLVKKYYGHYTVKGKNITDIYFDILSKLAQCFICHRNGRVALKYWKNLNDKNFIGPYEGLEKIELWNLLNRIMDTNIIVFKYLLDNDMREREYLYGYYSSIALEDTQLENILEKGVAETHLHKGASINFTLSWIQLMNNSSSDIYKNENLQGILLQNIGIQYYLKALMIARIVMGIFISRFSTYEKNFYPFIIEEFNPDEKDYSRISKQDKTIFEIIEKIFKGETIDEKYINSCKIKDLFNRLLDKYSLNYSLDKTEKEGLYSKDVMNLIFEDYEEIRTTSENIFIFESMKYIQEKEEKDDFFSGLFFQYIRLKNYVFQQKIQNDNIKGLDNFQKIYKRSTAYSNKASIDYWKILMESQLQNSNLKKLELRTGFSSKKNLSNFFKAYKDILQKYYNDCKPDEIPQIGLIFHFIKRFDENGFDKCWQNTNDLEIDELYYMKQRKNYMDQMETLNKIRNEIPKIDKYILGIDAASIENSTDPWVFAPIYEKARDSLTQKLVYEKNRKIKTRNLGFTFHVGEDFRHIVSGLRKIDEVIEHFKFHAGDRIGHGIALGADIKFWVSQNSIVTIPRGEYLEDLLWIWGLHKENGYLKDLDISYLECEIMSLAEEILNSIEGVTVYTLWKVYQDKFKDFKVDPSYLGNEINKKSTVFCQYLSNDNNEGFHNITGQIWTFESLRYVQHCRCYLIKYMEPIQVKVDKSYINLYTNLQKMLIKKICNLGIVVETNPTSNLSIGSIEDLFHHYIFNLNNKEHNPEGNSVLVTINSDDPSVFNTNVSNEMAYMFYALQEHNYTREEALNWIDKIRKYGMETSFIKDDNLTFREKIQELEDIITALE